MFHCDRCHTEFGGIRGLPAGSCPNCRSRGDGGISTPGFSLSPANPASRGELTFTLAGPSSSGLTFIGNRLLAS
ncbi:MAG: hypothetical protein ABW065_05300 [Solirubrobacterales bacterium]